MYFIRDAVYVTACSILSSAQCNGILELAGHFLNSEYCSCNKSISEKLIFRLLLDVKDFVGVRL